MKTPFIASFGEHGVLLRWEDVIDKKVHDTVLLWEESIYRTFRSEIIECVPGYSSLMIYLKNHISSESWKEKLSSFKVKKPQQEEGPRRTVTVPVCYEGDFAPDLERVANENNLSPAEVISLHSESEYLVYFIGFLPGFPYLGGLSDQLITPRLPTPRKFIPMGSVGIGGSQTGIYSVDSPGGWNVIGRTPLDFFSVEEQPPSLLLPGDHIRFRPISLLEYASIEDDIASGNYELESMEHD